MNDGSTDTAHVRGELMSRGGGWIVALDLPANVGQAGAVQCGIMATLERWTELVGYGDADLSAPLTALGELIEVFGPNPALETVIGASGKLLRRQTQRYAARHLPCGCSPRWRRW